MATTIDEVLSELTEIVDWCRINNSRLGYFAALYRKVTAEVKRGIEDGRFEDGARMAKLDVLFANRYLDAFNAHRAGQLSVQSWDYAFACCRRRRLVVLQHLLLGMNAHINLDLGIAAAHTSPGTQLADLRSDFDLINDILASLIDDVQSELVHVWPGLAVLLRITNRADDEIVNFSLIKARNAAWTLAKQLAPLSKEEQQPLILDSDRKAVRLAEVVSLPGPISASALMAIRFREQGSVREIIDILT